MGVPIFGSARRKSRFVLAFPEPLTCGMPCPGRLPCTLPSLEVQGISKRYGAVQALHEVSAHFKSGEIHAVLGENGAGKSTLVGILAGFVAPDAGLVSLNGSPLPLGKPIACRHAGIAMVHQHFMLVPDFTVAENLALDRLDRLGGAVDVHALSAPVLALADELGWHAEPDVKIRNLPVGVQQRIEILKVLADDAPVAIFDEPTAVLAPDEVLDLFRVLRQLRDSGKMVILIAHKLSEVMAVADRVTVLRRGKLVATAPIEDVNERELATWMVGDLPRELNKSPRSDTQPGLQLKDVWAKGDRGEDALRGITLEVRRGEILGIGGVDGNGQVELAEVAVGVRPFQRGTFDFHQETREPGRIAYIPQDRQSDGLALGMSIQDNMMIEGCCRPGLTGACFLNPRAIKEWANRLVHDFEIKTPSTSLHVGSLSGGNQQKVVVSRNLDETPEILVAVNPTRGLDIRAADFVKRQILKARDEGAAVLLVSTDLDELADLADRTLFLSRGELREASDTASLVGGDEP
jgi:ABC-type uncharacterized transport system ATPase subunit